MQAQVLQKFGNAAAQMGDDVKGVRNARGAKKYPGKTDQQERDASPKRAQKPRKAFQLERLHHFFAQRARSDAEYQIKSVQRSPNDVSPIGAVPKPAD